MNCCNIGNECGCWLGFNLSPYGQQLQNNLTNSTSLNNYERTGGILALEFRLNNLNSQLFPKANYFNLNPFYSNDETVIKGYGGFLTTNPFLYNFNGDCCLLDKMVKHNIL